MSWTPEVISSLPHQQTTVTPAPQGAVKTIWLLESSCIGCSYNTDYHIILFKSVCSPSSSHPFVSLPWLNNQKKVTFLRSDFHACSMLGRHFRFPKTFHVTHPSTQETANTPNDRVWNHFHNSGAKKRDYEIVQRRTLNWHFHSQSNINFEIVGLVQK